MKIELRCLSRLAIAIHEDNAQSLGKQPLETKSNKRAFSPETFDEFDSENVDPNILMSPSKKSKGSEGTPFKSAKPMFSLLTTPAVQSPAINRKALSLSVPTTTTLTPISRSRGSPKHKRVGLLSKGRRASSSPFRCVDPPKFNTEKATTAPFSIDAALSGTISSYKPASPAPKPAMPNSWFFEIHEDTVEEEAANLMEHSASILDISSDDDSEAKQRKMEEEVGKENVPPPDWTGPVPAGTRRTAVSVVHKGIHSSTKAAQKEEDAKKGDSMTDDRVALVEMPREDFFPDGLDEKSVEVVAEDKKAHALSREKSFDFVAPASPRQDVATTAEPVTEAEVLVVVEEVKREDIIVRPDDEVV